MRLMDKEAEPIDSTSFPLNHGLQEKNRLIIDRDI